ENGKPISIFDFDICSPGSPANELGWTTWHWLEIGNNKYSSDEQKRRLKVFCDEYGIDTSPVLEWMVKRQAFCAQNEFFEHSFREHCAQSLDWVKKNLV
ncbi:MAG: hypothetical protein KC493_14185, partial [Bacteriovoracaceae bacterium]|nr:hypothetical protein [Bacteriovoracaceae bacterium]